MNRSICLAALSIAALSAGTVQAQSQSSTQGSSPEFGAPAVYAEDAYAEPVYEGYEPPRNKWGQPDFSGVWSNGTTTRMERADAYGDTLILSEEQARAMQTRAEKYRASGDTATDPDAPPPSDGNTDLGYNRFWTDPGTQVMRVEGKPRSSFITYPANGKVPPRRAGAPPPPEAMADSDEANDEGGRNDNPESRGLSERCIFFQTTAGPVKRPVLYNNNYLIVQGKDSVAIVTEMVHTPQVITLGAKHTNGGVLSWSGDAIGHYDGDTLVVETTDFKTHAGFYGASEELTITERYTRVADNRLLYQFEVKDPVTWAEPWGGEYEFWVSKGFYEYACHEGNYGMYGILAGGRQEDAERAASGE